MQVTIEIDDGGKARKALPIRAIPYATSWRESPDSIVHTLAAPKTEKYGNGLTVRLRHNELFAYQMDAQGKYELIPPSQWESWVVTLDSLTKKSQADEREGAENENHAPWRIKAILELPDNVFFWLDEFQLWYSSTRPIIFVGTEPEDEDMEGGLIKEQDDTLSLTPIFPPEIENKVWRYTQYFEAQSTQAPKVEAVTTSADWCIQARAIADECFNHDTSMNCRDSLKNYSVRVMDIMQARQIKGPRGIIDNAATVMREALQGKQWWANKNK